MHSTPSRFVALAVALALAGRAQRTPPPSAPDTVLRSTAQEVLLDFVARDKHQKLVTNLRPDEVEILEDGVPQKVRSFQYRSGRPDQPEESRPIPATAGGGPAYSPLREINVVSLVFEGMSGQSRRQATQAAKDFLASERRPNTYIGVFALNNRLALLQQYTNDTGLLNQAVDRAASGSYRQAAKDIQAQVMLLNSLAAGGPGRFSPLQPGSAEGGEPISTASHLDAAAAAVERRMASLTIAMISSQTGNQSIDALHQLIRGQAQLPGRKTVIFFSEGLILPPDEPERFRALISDANRANIAFYTVDASGLDTISDARVSRTINAARRSVQPDTDAAAQPTNYQENLRSLAEDTGGFAIANTNDMRAPLRRVMEEVRAHYEVAYSPTSSDYDGHFRTIEVRTTRAGLRIQSRNGYFALPLLNGEPVAPFEIAALAALSSDSPPHAFEFHAGMLRFRSAADGAECRVVFSVPSRALSFTEDPNSKLFRTHVSFLALVKDDQGQIVHKISRDLPFQAPSGKRAEFERGEATVTLPLNLPPGRYHMEAAAVDPEGQTASTRKIAFFVPPAGLIGLSDLIFVRSVQPGGGDRDATDPLEFAGGKVTPELNPAVAKSDTAVESVYFILYPSPGIGAKPDVRIAIAHNGKLIAQVRPNLPASEPDGSLRVLSQIGLGGLESGAYEVQVTATQGGATASSSAVTAIL
jgi:VWFA-related protein